MLQAILTPFLALHSSDDSRLFHSSSPAFLPKPCPCFERPGQAPSASRSLPLGSSPPLSSSRAGGYGVCGSSRGGTVRWRCVGGSRHRPPLDYRDQDRY